MESLDVLKTQFRLAHFFGQNERINNTHFCISVEISVFFSRDMQIFNEALSLNKDCNNDKN